MVEPWILGAFAAVLTSIPAHLHTKLASRDGGSQPQQTRVLPVVAGDKQYALICYYETSGPVFGKMPLVYPPFASVQIAFPGKQVQWADITPKQVGLFTVLLTPEKEPYLGALERKDITMQEWRNADSRYDLLISRVLERQWLLTKHPVTAEEHTTAKELQDCVRILYDKPLLPYYQHEGRQFLAWLARAAK